MEKIGIIYSFNSKKTAEAVHKLNDEFNKALTLVNAETITEKEFLSFDKVILGVPTWFDGELPNYWDEFVPALEDMNLKGKTYAVFGNGDQKGYPENFIDGVGIMVEILEKLGARIVGFTSTKNYHFESSRAVRGDQFCGLALDFDNQATQSDAKIKKWAQQLKKEFGME